DGIRDPLVTGSSDVCSSDLQAVTGKKVVNGEDVRRGFETLKISAERWKALGLPDFAAPIAALSCSDHNGHHSAYMQQWDGAKWEIGRASCREGVERSCREVE